MQSRSDTNRSVDTPTLYHVHDPMCSWCWGYRKTWDALRAVNPSDNSTLITLAGELGLDVATFTIDLTSTDIEDKLQQQFARRRSIGVRSFPSLVFATRDKLTPIDIDYRSHRAALAQIEALLG